VLLAALALALCFAAPANAQPPPDDDPDAAPAETPAPPTKGVAPDEATQEQSQAATAAYVKGMEANQAKKHEEALEHFQESYGHVASPNSHLMIVQSLESLGRWADAYSEVQLLIVEADAAAAKTPKYKATAKAARAELEAIKAKIGLVTVTVDPFPAVTATLKLTLAGRELPVEAWGKPQPVTPGPVEVVLEGTHGTNQQQGEVAAGQETEIVIAPPKPKAKDTGPMEPDKPKEEPTDPAPFRYAAIGFGVIGVGGMVVFGVFGMMARSSYEDLLEQCPGDVCAADLEGTRDDAETQKMIANIGVAAGAVGFGVAAILLMLSDELGKPAGEADDTTPTVSVGPGGITVKGSF